jgi:GNAT superfamily N-acetyltransferase
MVLFADHEEYSASAAREGCAEVRDVFVAPDRRRAGVATAIMAALEAATRERGMPVGLSVSTSEEGAPARALYASLGYRHAHGPFVTSARLEGDREPIAVSAVVTYLVKPT